MKKRLLLIFIIIILMPIIVISVMAFNTYGDNEEKKLEREKVEATAMLQVNDRLLQNRFRLIENDFKELIPHMFLTPDEIRLKTGRVKLIRQAFFIDKSDKFIFPPEEGDMSLKEREFISDAGELELIYNLKAGISPEEGKITGSNWYTWFMGDGINFIYFTVNEGNIIGFMVERYALISELINVLPQTDGSDSHFHVELSDARGGLLYQWGDYTRETAEEPLKEFSISEPLGSWRFFYYFNKQSHQFKETQMKDFLLIPVLVLMTVIIILLSLYFYRENSREMHIAGQKVSFVNQVSHELKTPLTNIRLYSELLQNKLSDPGQLEYLDVIINEGSRLGRMINNVLTFSRGEQGELKNKIVRTDMNHLIDEVLEKFRPLLKENRMETIYRKTDLPIIHTDKDMIEQILVNLIGNAVKYGASGKYLAVETKLMNDFMSISIVDKGPGIIDREKENIFKPFYRIDNSLTQKNSGTGIGLSIARTLAEQTGCRLYLEKSKKGARFTITIPLKRNI